MAKALEVQDSIHRRQNIRIDQGVVGVKLKCGMDVDVVMKAER